MVILIFERFAVYIHTYIYTYVCRYIIKYIRTVHDVFLTVHSAGSPERSTEDFVRGLYRLVLRSDPLESTPEIDVQGRGLRTGGRFERCVSGRESQQVLCLLQELIRTYILSRACQ